MSATSSSQSVTGSARSNLTSQTQQAAGSIDAVLREAMKGVDSVAAGLSDGTLSKNFGLGRLRDGLEQHPDFLGSTVSYKPYAFNPGRRLYSAEDVNERVTYDFTEAVQAFFN